MKGACKLINKYVHIVILCLFVFLTALPILAQDTQYGLKFNSNNYDPEMRTSLNLTPDDYLSFPGGFSMSFDARFHFKDVYIYGYIFRIISNEGNTIDLVIGSENIVFTMPSGDIVSNSSLAEAKLVPEQWLSIQISADIKKEELGIKIGEFEKKWNTQKIKEFDKVKIIFGKSDYLGTPLIDVPDMTMKDLKITKTDGKPIYSWLLSRHTSNGVYDELKHRFAKCENPNWLLDDYGFWKKETELIMERAPYLSYDFDKNKVAAADARSFTLIGIGDGLIEEYTINKKLSYNMSANQMTYNTLDSSFYAYNLIKEGDAKEFVPFDIEKGEWGNTTVHENHTDYRHHNRYFSPKNNRLYLFGGYGHFKYKEESLIYDVDTKSWSLVKLKGDRIAPRYLSGMGKIDETHLLLFGGYGSETGDQSLQARFYYDCYLIDIEAMEAKRIWTMESPAENFAVSNSLVVDTANNCFYALCYPSMQLNSTISLYKFSLTEPTYEVVADQIPIKYRDVLSYVDLFFDKSGNRLIAATLEPKSQTEATVSIRTLSFPPFKSADIYQLSPKDKKRSSLLLVSAMALIVTLVILTLLFVRKKKRTRTERSVPEEKGEDIVPVDGLKAIRELKKPAIYLLGEFRVIDKEGNDISAHFKPLFKKLFLLILISTIKTGKGISFSKLKDILWFDKSEESANNNRGVALSKIRQIMENVGKVQFNKIETYWSTEFQEKVYCDYEEALKLITKIKENKEATINDIKELLSIVVAGEFLPNMPVEWADAFKADFSDQLVDLILKLINQKETIFSDSVYINMANVLFIHDPLNEDALKLKCSVLVKTGKNGLARNTYATFVKEYALLFGTEYKYSFDQIVN